MASKKPKTIDEYVARFPRDIQCLLEEVRQAIREAAPKASEGISYNIPAFELNGSLVWFAAFKDHIGFYPKSSGIEEFKEQLSAYTIRKGTVRFPLDKPLPLDLIKEIVRFRVKENLHEH